MTDLQKVDKDLGQAGRGRNVRRHLTRSLAPFTLVEALDNTEINGPSVLGIVPRQTSQLR